MFDCKAPYTIERPHVLVVACSDGRLQAAVDEFLDEGMGIRQFDRLFIPGGPAALAGASHEPNRSHHINQEYRFLLTAHDIQHVILMFHGPAPGGPPLTVCADYQRAMQNGDPDAIRRQQELDAVKVITAMGEFPHIRVQALWAEVTPEYAIQVLDHSDALLSIK